MIYSVRTRFEASVSLAESVRWYNGCVEGLGNQLLDELKMNYDIIATYPKGFREISAGIRQCPLKRFPYVVLYHIVDGTQLLVLAVYHTSRDPQTKLS